MMSKSQEELEELVFIDCKHPYIFQIEEGYRYFRLISGFIYTLILIISFIIWIKYRHLPRLIVRPLPVTILYFIFLLSENISGPFIEGFNNNINFLNSCVTYQFILHFGIFILLTASSLHLLQYFFRFRIFQIVTTDEVVLDNMRNSQKITGKNGNEKLLKFYKYTSKKFVIIYTLIGLGFSCCFGLFISYFFCPELNDNYICPLEESYDGDIYIFGGIATLLLILMSFIIYATFTFPDPFGIVREVLIILILYCCQIIIYFALIPFFKQASGKIFNFTPFLGVSIFGFLQFIYIFPYQIYLAFKNKTVEINLEDILNIPAAVKLFKIHLESEYCEDNLDFYFDVIKFENISEIKVDNMEDIAIEIYNKYIKVGCNCELNIAYDKRSEIIDIFETNKPIKKEIFAEIKEDIYSLMNHDSFLRFIQGPLYRVYLGLHNST